MSNLAYTTAFAVGYYYGRTGLEEGDMPEEDQAVRNTMAFVAGRERGKQDFQNVDVTKQALEAK